MNKKILDMFVCMLLIVTVVPVVESLKNSTLNSTVLNIPQTNMAGNWTEVQKLLASDGAPSDFFGWSVSVDGDTALIGTLHDVNDGVNFSGSVYVFTYNGTTWTQQAKLLASDGAVGYYFGRSISLDGDTALIGFANDEHNGHGSGSAYVFTRTGTTWTQQAKLIASDSAANDTFGYGVSLSGDTALIGAPHDGDNGYYSGSAYMFTRTGTTWTQQAKLLASDGDLEDQFGFSVSLDGNTAIIGAMDDEPIYRGSVYVFTHTGTTWTQRAKLFDSDGAVFDQFGFSVSLDGDTALIGARQNVNGKSSVYVFTQTGTKWTQQTKITVSDGYPLGWSESLDGNTALLGADLTAFHGAAYMFTRIDTTWTQQAKLITSDGAKWDYFGCSVSLSGDTAIIGAYGDDGDKGSAYVFTKEDENQPPSTPIITGPVEGKVVVATDYNFTAIDPDGYKVYYLIDWGDGTSSGWIGPYVSGDQITKSHTWSTKGTYTVIAMAKDIYGDESDWGTLEVTMPVSINLLFHQFIEKLFERFPHAFPILKQLLRY
jgi:hypothetical protein